MNDGLIDFTKELYRQIYYKLYKENFNFNPYLHKRILLKFFNLLKREFLTFGETFIKDFLEFTFNHYFLVSKNKIESEKIQIYWIFCEKSVLRFKNKKQNYTFSIRKNLKKQIEDKKEIKIDSQVKLENMQFEDKYKQIAYKEEDGLVICLQFTTLFCNKSQFCGLCVNMQKCKEKQKEIYPKLHYKNER